MDKNWAAWASRWRVPLGFAWGGAYLIFSQPTFRLLSIGGVIALVGLIVRACAAGYLEKGRRLATAGPYARTRNPLYFGSSIIGLGFAIAGGSWILGLTFLALFIVIYWPVMRREEGSLRGQFGEVYDRYAAGVPRFFPAGKTTPGCQEKFRWELYRKNRETEAAMGFAAAILFLILKIWFR